VEVGLSTKTKTPRKVRRAFGSRNPRLAIAYLNVDANEIAAKAFCGTSDDWTKTRDLMIHGYRAMLFALSDGFDPSAGITIESLNMRARGWLALGYVLRLAEEGASVRPRLYESD
jgi:hypothetical protein